MGDVGSPFLDLVERVAEHMARSTASLAEVSATLRRIEASQDECQRRWAAEHASIMATVSRIDDRERERGSREVVSETVAEAVRRAGGSRSSSISQPSIHVPAPSLWSVLRDNAVVILLAALLVVAVVAVLILAARSDNLRALSPGGVPTLPVPGAMYAPPIPADPQLADPRQGDRARFNEAGRDALLGVQ